MPLKLGKLKVYYVIRRVPFEQLLRSVENVLLGLGMPLERAGLAARLTAQTDRDGVQTHGIARLPRFVEMVRLGRIDVRAEPVCQVRFGGLERWSARQGAGNLAAWASMARAMELADEHGVGMVALAQTSHWMRAGTYGWQAAEAGYAAMCWSNTLPNLPPWGASSPALGNKPLVLAVPGEPPVVLDMAMSQFSYGTLAQYAAKGELLPAPGGYDERGELTQDAAAIERSQRALPVGFWKGSGLAFVLDVLGAMLAGGKATHEFSPDPLEEVGQSQVFLAVKASAVATLDEMRRVVDGAIKAVHNATPIKTGVAPRYPGEGVLRAREESTRLGVAVEEQVWQALIQLERGDLR
jgi:3-dehydro-L-gulonate 2-dehydrogenase